MAFRIFYSWQTDSSPGLNRNFIGSCLEKAVQALNQKYPGVDFVIDQDARGMGGSPELPDMIRLKIRQADAFVGDISIVLESSPEHRGFSNPNVVYEVGFADREVGIDRVLLVANTGVGKIESIQFDLRHRSIIAYRAVLDAQPKTEEKKRLTSILTRALETIYLKPARVKMAFTPDELTQRALRERDTLCLKTVLEAINTGYMDQFIEQASIGIIWNDIFHFFHDFEALVSAGTFSIYDSVLDGIIGRLYSNWSIALSFPHRCDTISNTPTRFKFRSPPSGISKTDLEEWREDEVRFAQAVQGTANAYRDLLQYRKEVAPLIDLNETNRVSLDRNLEYINNDRR